jgi:two-component system, NtrC family, response regulator PilR
VQPQSKGGRILIVDDEQGMREFLSICLTRAGHQCVAVGSGSDAIELLDGRQFDLVITDLTMPGVSGMTVLEHAVALPTPPLVIMITAFATTDTAIEAIRRARTTT